MNRVLGYLQIKSLKPDASKAAPHSATSTGITDGTDSPRDYQPPVRKPRAPVKVDVESSRVPQRLRATLDAQNTAGKQDSAEMYKSCFATAKSEPMPQSPAAPVARPAATGWLRAADYSLDALVAMPQADFDRVDFSRPARRQLWDHDLCAVSQERWLSDAPWELPAPTGHRAVSIARRAASEAGSCGDDGDSDLEYIAEVGCELRPKLSAHGASLIARMSDADLARCDVADYFE